ncbi:hypothetical protein [Chryseobacterium potabilaquae]|uniref:Uncharacterized protein n=1 Tax=Chryseobacterium potabilaquae TaxID=2675057 RepID=A0A6N4X985_9FLAO|nr:hypothetical protein [Chryseobacterium potabilaquae]CAA7196821.1 hypothetical protein CHRY9293_02889 [Chryseobacterium potabilaquae]
MLTIEIRKHQHVDQNGNNVLIDCTNAIATYISGTIPDNDWIDITQDCENLDTLEFSEKQPDKQNKQREKGATSQIVIGFDAYHLIMDWLMSTPCSFLNYFDVRITDTELNYQYKPYELKPDNIEMCQDEGCQLTLPLRESDHLKSVVDKLSIHDNWQGWFGGGAKDFPCIQVFKHLNAMTKAFTIGAWAVVDAIKAFSIIGLFIDISTLYKKAYGFGNFLPSPYIRDILENCMSKIGYTINTPFDVGKFAENDVFVYSNGYYHTNYDDEPLSPSQKFIFENRLVWQLSDFLEAICDLYCSIWVISGTTLYIIPQKDNDNTEPVLEIAEQDVVSDCKTFSFEKGKAGGNYEYSKDSADTASGDTINEYNDVVDFDGVTNNAMLEGLFDKKFRFSSSSFWGDSFGDDMQEEIENFSIIVAVLIAIVLSCVALSFVTGTAGANVAAGGFIASAAIVIAATVAITGAAIAFINGLGSSTKYGYSNAHFKGSLKVVGTGSIFTPRIIRMNPGSDNRNKKPVIISSDSIQINPYYNTFGISWRNQWTGYGYGDFNEAFNYPLFFDSLYFGTLYDTLHEKADNALFLSQSNESRKLVIPLCGDYLSKTGVNNDQDSIIGKIILYKNTRYKVIDFQIKYTDLSITFNLKKQNEII